MVSGETKITNNHSEKLKDLLLFIVTSFITCITKNTQVILIYYFFKSW